MSCPHTTTLHSSPTSRSSRSNGTVVIDLDCAEDSRSVALHTLEIDIHSVNIAAMEPLLGELFPSIAGADGFGADRRPGSSSPGGVLQRVDPDDHD